MDVTTMTAESDCIACDVGHFCPVGAEEQTPCAAGTYNDQAAQAGCRLLVLGSCALGVPGPGADVDCVAVVPYFVERTAFFANDGLCAHLLCIVAFF